MFGYVKAYKPELRIKEFELYKAVYCSFCRDIGKKYSIISRFSLSYDFVFLALLYLSLRDGCINIDKKSCVYNPLKKCNFLRENELPEFILASAQIMLYYKLIDNIKDEGFFKTLLSRLLKLFSQKGYKKAAEQYPEAEKIFNEYFKQQTAVEEKKSQNMDEAADPTANMLSKLFAACAVEQEDRALKRLGYCLGRWIYLMDAASDLNEDISKNRYNPLKNEAALFENTDVFFSQKIKGELNVCIKEAAAAFELLDIKRFKNILGNIIYLGLEEGQQHIFKENK